MKLSLIVRGQHPPGDTVQHLRDDLDLVRCADQLGFDGIVKGSHFSAYPFEFVQQIPFLAYCAAIAPRLRIICRAGAIAQAARSGRATGHAGPAVRRQAGARHAERLELDIAVADAAAEHELAAGHDVQRRQLLGQIERLVQRHQHQAADDPQSRRDRRAIGRETGSAARYSNGWAL